MASPEQPEIFESELATYWFDQGFDGARAEKDLLLSSSKTAKRTVENTRDSFALIKRITGNRKVGLIVHLKYSPKPDKATREFVARELPEVYKAMAMISKSGLANLIMFLLFKLKPPPIPMKSFSNEADAREWIKRFL